MRLRNQVVLFAFIGGLATGSQYVVLFILVERFAANEVVASSIGALVGAIVSYVLNYRITFQSARPHRSAFSRFILVASLALLLNGILFSALLHFLNVFYMFAQVLTTIIVMSVTFTGARLWAFRK
jgi:putative flippase GtrA